MSSVDKVKSICKERKIPISRLERDLGYANGYIGQLRKGTFPNDRLVEIANYLGVSTSYLTGEDNNKKSSALESAELNPVDIKKFLHTLSDAELIQVMSDIAEIMGQRNK